MQQKFRVPQKFVIAASGGPINVNQEVPIPVTNKVHMFQASASCNITPVLYSGSDGEAQALATGETWETTAPLRGFKCNTACNVFYISDIA